MEIENLIQTTALIELHVPDFEKTTAFYRRLGFMQIRADDSYRVLAKDNNVLSFYGGNDKVFQHKYFSNYQEQKRGVGVEIIIFEKFIDLLYLEFANDSALVEELRKRPWGGGVRDFRLMDPWGYYLRITEPYDNFK